MHFLTTVAFSLLLLLASVFGPLVGQDDSVSTTTRGFVTITTTVTFASAKLTRTMTKTVTSFVVPTYTTYTTTSTSSTPPLQPTSTSNPSTPTKPPHIGHESSASITGKLIGLLFAGGAVLLLFTIILLALCVKRHRQIQQKRIDDWVAASALHDRHSVLGNCGTPPAEMAAWRGDKSEMGTDSDMRCPEKAVGT